MIGRHGGGAAIRGLALSGADASQSL